MIVQEINFVQDLTVVDVRYRASVGGALRAGMPVNTGEGELAPFTHSHRLATSNGAPDVGRPARPQTNGVRAEQIR
jgi:hypothetical protein